MTKIWKEEDVTPSAIDSHVRTCGFEPVSVKEDEIWLRTESGIGFRISLLEDKKFVKLGTFLPLDVDQSEVKKLELERHLNAEIFLPVFTIDDDGDLSVSYVMTYQYGLIVDQFVAILTRFGSVLEYIVECHNQDGIIDFSPRPKRDVPNQLEGLDATSAPPIGTVFN